MKFWLIAGIPIFSYLLLRKTFNLALYGDDWLQLYNLWLSFDVHKTLSFFDIRSYLSPYWPQYFFLGIIRHFFGYQAQAYFAVSLILRVLATISLYFLSYEFSKSRLAAFLVSLFFTFSVAGLQTTDWVFNMNTYAGIFFFNFALIMYLKIRNLKTFLSWRWLFFILLFFLALGVVPVRMHGAIPFLVLSEATLFFLLDKKEFRKIDRFLIIRLTLPVLIMFMLIRAGSFGSEGDTLPLLATSFSYLQSMLRTGRFDILFYFPGIIGNIVIPNTTNPSGFFGYLLTLTVFFTPIDILIAMAVKANKLAYIALILGNLLWAILGNLLTTWNPNLPFPLVFSITAGFQTIILSLVVFNQTYKVYPYLATSIIIALFWIISFSLLYWLRAPYLIIESTGRYMILGAVGFSIMFSCLLSIMIKNFIVLKISSFKTRLIKPLLFTIPLFLLCGWLNINIRSADLYLSSLEANRNLSLSNRTWNDLKKYVPKLEDGAPSVFYFTSDNPVMTYMVLTFGFWPHAGLVYGIANMENSPLPTESYSELLEMVRTGEPLKRVHARKEIPVPLSRVFAFDFRNGQLTPITDLVREKLTQDLGKF